LGSGFREWVRIASGGGRARFALRRGRRGPLVIRQGYPHPIAYTFEADYHCPVCTEERFGVDESGFPAEGARDSEGNPIGAVAPWDEWHEPGEELPQVLACGSCGAEIERL